MARADVFLRKYPNLGTFKVEGFLIGSISADSDAEKVFQLNYKMTHEMGPNANWRIFDILEVLKRTRNAHREIWNTYKKASTSPPTASTPLPPAQPPG
jgi:hypothetical protein